MQEIEKEFIIVEVTTPIKVYTTDPDVAKESALNIVSSMGWEAYKDNAKLSLSSIRSESAELQEYKIVDEDLDIWGYEIDSRSFMLDYGLSVEDEEEQNEPLLIDLDSGEYEFDEVMQSPVIHINKGNGRRYYVEIDDDMTDFQIATKIYAEITGL